MSFEKLCFDQTAQSVLWRTAGMSCTMNSQYEKNKDALDKGPLGGSVD